MENTDALKRLSEMAQQQREYEHQLAAAQARVEELENQLRIIAEEDIPALMDEVGVSEFTTSTGLKVRLDENIFASISEATNVPAIEWLDTHNYGNLVKRNFTITFQRDEEDWARKFVRDLARRKRKLVVAEKRTVHPRTLSAFVSEKLKEGVDVPLELFNVFRKRVSKISVRA
jgi:hypothetical protein